MSTNNVPAARRQVMDRVFEIFEKNGITEDFIHSEMCSGALRTVWFQLQGTREAHIQSEEIYNEIYNQEQN